MTGRRPRERVRVGVAVPAAGSGQRMGGARKPFLELGGEPMLKRAIAPFLAEPRVVAVAVALAADDALAPPDWLEKMDSRVRIVTGGATRAESVRLALAALPEDLDVVAVHDAARPMVTPELLARCIDVAVDGEGAIAGCPAVDTIKEVDPDGVVLGTPDRRRLWHAHTPQVFPAEALRKAYEGDLEGVTDDASLMECTGLQLRMVDGGPTNLKVTRSEDLILAEALLRALSEEG